MESRMKKAFLFSTVIIAILLIHNVALGEDFKIGLIDLQRCLEKSKEGQKIFQLLKKKKDVLQRQLDKKQKELLDLRNELEKQGMMLSMSAQENKKKTIERKARELEYFFKDVNEEMIRAQEKEKKRIFKELSKVIEKIGSEGNYALIMEKRAGGVLYWADSIDITEELIKAYDQIKEEKKE